MSTSGDSKFRFTVVDHPLVQAEVAILRDRSTGLAAFRDALRRLAVLVGVEAFRSLRTRECEVQTPLAKCEARVIDGEVVIVPILRAGLGLAEGLLTLVPGARVGHVGLYRDEETFEPQSYYFKTPELRDADVFLVDPMLATGQSAADAADKVKAAGARRLTMLALIGAEPGLRTFHERHPEIPVFLAALDPELNEKAYIVPGLGDAGDRFFGT